MRRKKAIIVTNIGIVLVSIAGLIFSIAEYGWGMFRFYTQNSNFFAAISSILLLVYLFKGDEVPKWLTKMRYVAVLGLAITFIITALVLAPLYGKDYFRMFTDGSKLYQHLLCPLLYFVSFFALEKRVPMEKSCIYCGIIPTVVYAVVLVILNLLKIVDGPYPFLRVYDQSIFVSFMWAVCILGFDYLMAWAVWKLGALSQKTIVTK